MRLAMAYRHLRDDGGTGRYGIALARGLLRKGHGIVLVCQDAELDAEFEPYLALGSLEVHRLRIPTLPGLLSMEYFAYEAARAVRHVAPDLSLALGRVPGLDIYRAGGGCHEVYLSTLVPSRRSLRDYLELRLDRACARRAIHVVVNASLPGRQLIERYQLNPTRVTIIPNGVDSKLFKPDSEVGRAVRLELGLDEAQPVALFLGSGFVRKGLMVAIQALSSLKSCALLVIGADRGVESYRSRARALGLDLRLLGSRRDPERFLAASNVMILPTRYDAASNAVLEAMACGVPPVTSSQNGAAEFIPDPELVVDSAQDVKGFTRAVRYALGNATLSHRCRASALKLTWERSAEEMEALLHDVLQEKATL